METTTRKLWLKDVCLLKEMQKHMSKRGMKLSQQELLDKIIRFVTFREGELMKEVLKKREKEPWKRWFETIVEGKTSDAVKEHDQVI